MLTDPAGVLLSAGAGGRSFFAGDLRVRVAEAFERFGPQPRCPFTVDGLAFQVARVRAVDGPPAGP